VNNPVNHQVSLVLFIYIIWFNHSQAELIQIFFKVESKDSKETPYFHTMSTWRHFT